MKNKQKYGVQFSRIFLAAILLLLIAACNDQLEDATAEQLMEKAYASAYEGQWEEALKLTTQAYSQRPDDTSVRLLHALALENNGRNNDALEVSRLAAEDTKSFFAQYTYGRMLFQQKKFTQAQTYLKRAEALKKDDFNTMILLQQTAAHLNQFEENPKLCENLFRLYGRQRGADFSAYVYNELAINIIAQQRLNKRMQNRLLKIFERANKVVPSSPELAWNQAVFYDYYLGNPVAAKTFYEKFLRLTEKYSGMEKERTAVKERLYKTEK